MKRVLTTVTVSIQFNFKFRRGSHIAWTLFEARKENTKNVRKGNENEVSKGKEVDCNA